MKPLTKFAIAATALLALGSYGAFAVDVSLGTALGARTYQSDGGIYSAPQAELDLFIDGMHFGCNLFVDVSFNTSEASKVDKFEVTYNSDSSSCVAGIGVAPYYRFQKSEALSFLAGPVIALRYHRSKNEYHYPSAPDYDYDIKHEALSAQIGLFVGARFVATERLSVLLALPVTSQLMYHSFGYAKDDFFIDNYKNESFGGGGGSAVRTYVTPKIGIAYKF